MGVAETYLTTTEVYDLLLRTNSILIANGCLLGSILGVLLILCFIFPWKG